MPQPLGAVLQVHVSSPRVSMRLMDFTLSLAYSNDFAITMPLTYYIHHFILTCTWFIISPIVFYSPDSPIATQRVPSLLVFVLVGFANCHLACSLAVCFCFGRGYAGGAMDTVLT